jgi:hypothetical protein
MHLLILSLGFSVSHDADGSEIIRSMGDGIEREAFHLLMEGYRSEGPKWLTPQADGHYSVATTHTMYSARFISPSRIRNVTIFGAVVALCLVRGVSARPLDPVVLYFFIHNLSLNSIHRQLLREWHPALQQLITDWLSIGAYGDLSAFKDHFATYHNLQVRSSNSYNLQFSLLYYLRSLHYLTVTNNRMMQWQRKCFTGLLLG